MAVTHDSSVLTRMEKDFERETHSRRMTGSQQCPLMSQDKLICAKKLQTSMAQDRNARIFHAVVALDYSERFCCWPLFPVYMEMHENSDAGPRGPD